MAASVIKKDIWRAAIISITIIRSREQLADPGTLKRYTEHHETTQCKYIADECASCVQFETNNAEKKGMTVSGTLSQTKKTSQLRGVIYSRNKSGKVFVSGPYNAKEALMITGAWRPTLPSCVSNLLEERDSVTVV